MYLTDYLPRWFAPLALLVFLLILGFSPTVAGFLWRVTISVWLVWLDWIDFESFVWFTENVHW